MEGFHLRLGLAQFHWRGKGFGYRLAASLTSETEVGSMSGTSGLVTVAVWLAAFAAGSRDGTAAEVPERKDLTESRITLFEERRE